MKTTRENPVLYYHLLGATRHRWKRQPWLYGGTALGVALLYLFTLQLVAYNDASVDVTLWLSLFVMCIAAPLMAYNLFSSEYEKQTWESLALTRLTAREIFWGKWGAALARVALTTGLLAPFLLTPGRATHYTVVAAFAALFGWGALLASAGLWLSFKLKRTLASAAALYAGQVFALLLFPMLYAIVSGGSEPPGFAIRWVQSYTDGFYAWVISLLTGSAIFFLNPFYMASELRHLDVPPTWLWRLDDPIAYVDGLSYMLWGYAQAGVYLALAWLFAGLTYRGLKFSWRK